MKKLLLITLLCAIAMGNLNAQIKTTKTLRNTQNLNQAITPPPPPPPPTNSKTAGPISNTEAAASVYTLTSVRISIKTGNDNKEFPSGVFVELWNRNHVGVDYLKDCLFKIHNLKNEMKVNSMTEFGLDKYNNGIEKYTLETLQRNGLVLNVGYLPNFFMDAWKIEGISLTLEFKDQNGNPHPTYGVRTLTFSNAVGFLNNDYHYMICKIDESLTPIAASIEKNPK